MASRTVILKALTRARLLELARGLEIDGLSAAKKGTIVASLARRRRITTEEILARLTRNELRAACRAAGVDDQGRSKAELAARLLPATSDAIRSQRGRRCANTPTVQRTTKEGRAVQTTGVSTTPQAAPTQPVMTHLERLQNLLRGLFQFDLADLDTGIYRLLHLKRAEVEAFLWEQLPRQVDEAFAAVTGDEQADLQKQLDDLTKQIKEQIAEDAIEPTGEIKPEYRDSPVKVVQDLVGQYERAWEQQAAIEVSESRKAEVFNHLYSFFSRYYEEGDFIPRRRYGARETYAVPYNGEEVFFHWANRDQHYVKTAENFKDLAFRVSSVAGDYRVRFCLTEASVPKDNTKGDRRYFFPRPDAAQYDEDVRQFSLPFEYRLPTAEEIEQFGKDAKGQDAVLAHAVDDCMHAVPDGMLRATLAADQRTEKDIANDKPELPLLLKRMRHFCRRNTSDYFIHKNLRQFLLGELEFYIKDQVLHIEDLGGDFEAKRRMIRVLRRLGEQVIEFLAQIEDAQKRLFEKKKVTVQPSEARCKKRENGKGGKMKTGDCGTGQVRSHIS